MLPEVEYFAPENGKADMPLPFLILIVFIFFGVATIGGIFMSTGPMQDQVRSPHEISRQENGLAR